MDRGAWQTIVHKFVKSWTWLSDFHFISLQEMLLDLFYAMDSFGSQMKPTSVFAEWGFKKHLKTHKIIKETNLIEIQFVLACCG